MGEKHSLQESKFKGIPLIVYEALPVIVRENLEDIEYTSELVWEKIHQYFEKKTIEDFANNFIKAWEEEFNDSYVKSYNKLLFLKEEIEKYNLSKREEYTDPDNPSFFLIKIDGYKAAVSGNNREINVLLNKLPKSGTDELTIERERYISEEHQYYYYYKIIPLKLQKLCSYIAGYAYAMMENNLNKKLHEQNTLNYELNHTNDTYKIDSQKVSKIAGLEHKQQMILLQKLGFFDLPNIKDITLEQKGNLLSNLLNRGQKNCKVYLTNIDVPKESVSMDKDFVKTKKNLKIVNDLLKELGIEKK